MQTFQYVGGTSTSWDEVSASMREYAARTNGSQIRYGFATQNSNSYTFGFMRSLGFTDVAPTAPNVNPIGWENDLPLN